jgi:hypothetical protein
MLTIGVQYSNIKHNVGYHSCVLYQVISHSCRWISPGISVTCTYKTYRHDATEILLTMVLNTITIAITLLVTT